MEEKNHSDTLNDAREVLLRAMRLSKQASYERRAPNPESLPHFEAARASLTDALTKHPTDRQALMMMSQLSECLMDFDSAIEYLNRAIAAGEPRSNKTLKRLALLRENSTRWRELSLTPESVRELGDFLEANRVGPNDRSLELTRKWLIAKGISDPEKVIESFESHGAFSDFQVLANVVYG